MAPISLNAIDGTLSFIPSDLPEAFVEAYQTSLIWAQAVSRTQSDDASSGAYWGTLSKELRNTGWSFSSIGDLEKVVPPGKTLAATLVTEEIPYWPPAGQFPALELIFRALETAAGAPPDGGDAALLQLTDFWWSKVAAGESIATGFGPLYQCETSACVHLATVKVDCSELKPAKRTDQFDLGDWRSLFVEIKPKPSVAITTRHAVFELNIENYNSVADALRARIEERVAAHLAQASLLVPEE
ncbi:MAG: hypothetical protein ACXVBY_16885 [Isosphaeraceae bacterium]